MTIDVNTDIHFLCYHNFIVMHSQEHIILLVNIIANILSHIRMSVVCMDYVTTLGVRKREICKGEELRSYLLI